MINVFIHQRAGKQTGEIFFKATLSNFFVKSPLIFPLWLYKRSIVNQWWKRNQTDSKKIYRWDIQKKASKADINLIGSSFSTAPDNSKYSKYSIIWDFFQEVSFLQFLWNIYCGISLELPQQGISWCHRIYFHWNINRLSKLSISYSWISGALYFLSANQPWPPLQGNLQTGKSQISLYILDHNFICTVFLVFDLHTTDIQLAFINTYITISQKKK